MKKTITEKYRVEIKFILSFLAAIITVTILYVLGFK
jgi:hypothetical protein